jgi:hypothetical protein
MASPADAPLKHYLSTRDNWQLAAQSGGAKTRDSTADVLRTYLDATYPGQFEVTKEPADLKQIYYLHDWKQNPEAYQPDTTAEVWWDASKQLFLTKRAGKAVAASGGGCTPDVKILCKATGRAYFIECKHQNDAGNAHERAAKYATSSIIALIQEIMGAVYHPVGYLFSGSMTEKRKYQLELRATFAFAGDHLFLWDTERTAGPLVAWLERVVMPLLRG